MHVSATAIGEPLAGDLVQTAGGRVIPVGIETGEF